MCHKWSVRLFTSGLSECKIFELSSDVLEISVAKRLVTGVDSTASQRRWN